jgi:hypothetical protein
MKLSLLNGHRVKGQNKTLLTTISEDKMQPLNPEDSIFQESDTCGISALEQRQQLLSHHVRMVARKLSHALFVFGSQGGLGKSRTIFRTLEEEGVRPLIVNSHCTPLSLYSTLYLFKDDTVIFFDDVDSMFSSMAHLGLLRSALWGNPRVMTYGSSQLPSDLPQYFEFTSRCIFAANVVPKKNDAFKAMLSRCDVFELSATNEEVVDLMRSVSADGFRNLPSADCNMVIDYIAENSADKELSMRLLGPSLRKLQFARSEGLDWRQLVKSQLTTLGRKQHFTKRLDNKTKDVRVLKEALALYPESIKDQQSHFCAETKKSRATFYRILSRHRDETEALPDTE